MSVDRAILVILAATACSVATEPHASPGPTAPVVDARTAVDTATSAADAPLAVVVAPRIELTFAGDIMFGGLFNDRWFASGAPNPDPLGEVAPLLASDLALANLETTVVTSIPRLTGHRRFAATPDQVGLLSRHGLGAVTLANNHIADLDDEGMAETPGHLRNAGLAVIGAPRLGPTADRPLFHVESMTVRGWTIGFVAATTKLNRRHGGSARVPFVADPRDLEAALVPVIAAAKATHDLVIVVLHWGVQYADAPSTWQIDAAHAFIDAGASAVVGHHPHVLQGIERYRDGVIAYSLGNFVFRNAAVPGRLTGVLRLGFRRRARCLDTVAFHPAVQVHEPEYHPVIATGRDLRAVARRLSTLSAARPLATPWTMAGDRMITAAACPP